MFLHKSLGDSQTFVNSYQGKIKPDFQYKLDDAQDWATELEHL